MVETPESMPAERRTALLSTVRQPRVMLLLLAGWAIIGAVTELFTSSGIFLDLKGVELDGILAGRALSWEAVPLAVLYLYCARDPARYARVFWLALIEQVAAIVANIYHWGAGDFSFESVLIPVVVAAALAVLVSLHLFEPRTTEPGNA